MKKFFIVSVFFHILLFLVLNFIGILFYKKINMNFKSYNIKVVSSVNSEINKQVEPKVEEPIPAPIKPATKEEKSVTSKPISKSKNATAKKSPKVTAKTNNNVAKAVTDKFAEIIKNNQFFDEGVKKENPSKKVASVSRKKEAPKINKKLEEAKPEEEVKKDIPPKEEPKNTENFDKMMEKINKKAEKEELIKKTLEDLKNSNHKLTENELRAVKNQVKGCWYVQGGIEGKDDLKIALLLFMNRDATINRIEVINEDSYLKSPTKKVFYEQVLRALKDPKCIPLKLPQDNFATWQIIYMVFDPREIL